MGVALIGRGNVVFDGAFDHVHVLARCDPGAVADAKNMGINRLCGHPPPHVQNHIRGLAPNPGQADQRAARRRHLAAEIIDQNLRHLDDILGLVAEKPDGFYMLDQAVMAQFQHRGGGLYRLKQRLGCLVHPGIRGLRRQGDRDQQGIDIHVVQLALGFGFGGMEPRKHVANRLISHLVGHAHLYRLKQGAGQGKRRRKRVAIRGILRQIRRAGAKQAGMMHENSDPYHYQVIRRAIAAIDAAGGATLPLADLAGEVNMSQAHFQRLFSQWVGVSPKRYQQYLVLGHAKSLLAERFTTLDTAGEIGLSGTGRLHDLFVRWEAMSPGDFARKGRGLHIDFGWFDSAFGPALAMGTDRGLCGMAFAAETGRAAAMQDLTGRWPAAAFHENPDRIAPWVGAALAQSGQVNLHLLGAPFQIKVWEALLRIPSGHVTTYSEIATAIAAPKAARAVGTAVGRNPVSWLIPCHRALRKSGALGGYHWGLPVKRAMLAWEGARLDGAGLDGAGLTDGSSVA